MARKLTSISRLRLSTGLDDARAKLSPDEAAVGKASREIEQLEARVT